MQQQSPPEQFDLAGMVADLNSLLRLKTTVIGMKMFARALDEGRRHLVTVRNGENGRPEIEFNPELGDVGRAFVEASKRAPDNRPS